MLESDRKWCQLFQEYVSNQLEWNCEYRMDSKGLKRISPAQLLKFYGRTLWHFVRKYSIMPSFKHLQNVINRLLYWDPKQCLRVQIYIPTYNCTKEIVFSNEFQVFSRLFRFLDALLLQLIVFGWLMSCIGGQCTDVSTNSTCETKFIQLTLLQSSSNIFAKILQLFLTGNHHSQWVL